jgi:3-deoxy-D-manno-octulosonic-acid transferase
LRIAAKDDLASTLIELLGNRVAAKAIGARAKEVFDREAGATGRCVAAIRALLGAESGREQER